MPKDYPPPIHPEVEVEAVSPISPSILKLKLKDEAVEEETVNFKGKKIHLYTYVLRYKFIQTVFNLFHLNFQMKQ